MLNKQPLRLQRAALLAALSVLILSCNLLTGGRVTPALPSTEPSTEEGSLPATTAPETSPTSEAGAVQACFPSSELKPSQSGLGDPYDPNLGNGGYDAQHYILSLTYDVDSGQLTGDMNMQAKATQALKAFNLDFSGFEVQQVLVDQKPASFSRTGGEMQITPEQPIEAGSSFDAAVTYSGHPEAYQPNAIDVSMGWNTYEGGTYAANEPDGANHWYPVNDHPCDKATYTFHITVPKGYQAAANGLLQDTVENGDQVTYTFESAYPIASYLVTVDIAKFTVENKTGPHGLPIRNYYDAGLAEQASPIFARTGDMIQFYESIMGPYPFEAYGVVLVNNSLGFALETQTLSLFGSSILESKSSDNTVAHELAHQWFGDSVSLEQWDQIWLNEGFATYASFLWLEKNQGRAVVENILRDYYSLMQERKVPPPGSPPKNDLFNLSVYFRGALTLEALRNTVGDEAFYEILRQHAQRHRYSNASTQEFIALAEEVSGKDLHALFDQWLYQNELPPFPAQGTSIQG